MSTPSWILALAASCLLVTGCNTTGDTNELPDLYKQPNQQQAEHQSKLEAATRY